MLGGLRGLYLKSGKKQLANRKCLKVFLLYDNAKILVGSR